MEWIIERKSSFAGKNGGSTKRIDEKMKELREKNRSNLNSIKIERALGAENQIFNAPIISKSLANVSKFKMTGGGAYSSLGLGVT